MSIIWYSLNTKIVVNTVQRPCMSLCCQNTKESSRSAESVLLMASIWVSRSSGTSFSCAVHSSPGLFVSARETFQIRAEAIYANLARRESVLVCLARGLALTIKPVETGLYASSRPKERHPSCFKRPTAVPCMSNAAPQDLSKISRRVDRPSPTVPTQPRRHFNM